MAVFREFEPLDLLKTSAINLDSLTEQYNYRFYAPYFLLAHQCLQIAEHPNGEIMAYMLGKIENKDDAGTNGHISALTVHAKFRKVGMAQQLINDLEDVCENSECKFVDLFVRSRNINAVRLYTMTGYLLYQRLINYYCDSENDEIDCYDMRKSVSSDYVVPAERSPLRVN